MHLRRFHLIALAATLALAATTSVLGAQTVRSADSLLRRGMFDRAESTYYALARARPRDPNIRFALGQYLLARGALRIGATLIDEAAQFGYDKSAANAVLARVYMDLGEYAAVERLSPSPLSPSERALVHWLLGHPSKTTAPDSTVLVAYTRTTAAGFLGSARLRVNGQPVLAMVSPRSGCGLRISDTAAVARRLRRFSAESGTSRIVNAAADSVGFGRMSMTNVPVSIEPLSEGVQAVVCFGLLGRFAPTFDGRASLMTLRLGGLPPAPSPNATRFAILGIDSQYNIAQGGGWAPLVLPQVSGMLADRRWTFDPRRGQVTLEP